MSRSRLDREADALLVKLEREAELEAARKRTQAVAVTGSAPGWPAGRPPVQLSVTMQLTDVPREPAEVRDAILEAAGGAVGQIVLAAVHAIEQATGVPLDPEPASVPWNQMRPAALDPAQAADIAAKTGLTLEQVTADEQWINDRYQCSVRRLPSGDGRPPMAHLSIRRKDRAAVRDWRDFQRIKNDVVGPECEAAELYPAESRLVDHANQYHLWCILDPAGGFPFGFEDRDVAQTAPEGLKAKQRAFCEADRPADAEARTGPFQARERLPAAGFVERPDDYVAAQERYRRMLEADITAGVACPPELIGSGLPDDIVGPAATHSPARVAAPWTPAQVAALNAFQADGRFHEYTCGGPGCRAPLEATPEGWVCPLCGYTQDWALAGMTDGSLLAAARPWDAPLAPRSAADSEGQPD